MYKTVSTAQILSGTSSGLSTFTLIGDFQQLAPGKGIRSWESGSGSTASGLSLIRLPDVWHIKRATVDASAQESQMDMCVPTL